MDTFVKLLKWLLISALVLGAIFLLVIFNLQTLERAYERWTFEHSSVVEDVYVGMPKADILFKFGEPDRILSDRDALIYKNSDTYSTGENGFLFKDGRLVRWVSVGTKAKGPRSTERLMDVAGDPFIEAHDSDRYSRRYTYTTSDKEGASYAYEINKLTAVSRGKLGWWAPNEVSFYAVKGTQVCPGNMCPFDLEQEDTPLKDEWKDKSVWDLIDKYDL